MTSLHWNTLLLDQLAFHWDHALRPRLEGLTDEEYLWEPVPSWSVRPRAEATTPRAMGAGDLVIDYSTEDEQTTPFTTIAWRIGHLVVGVFGERNHSHFGGPPISYANHHYAGTADEALAQLDEVVAFWRRGVEALGEEGLSRPCGPAEGPFADSPLAELVLHIHREALHHGAEVALLRDLYAHTRGPAAR